MSTSGFREDERASTASTLIGLLLLVVVIGVVLGPIPFNPLLIIGVLFVIAAIAAVSAAVEIVDPYEKRVLTVFGDFREVLEPGIHFVPPFVSDTHNYDMRTHTIDVPKQEAITRDNSPVVANAVVFIRVMDAKKAFLEVEDYQRATSNLAQTTLRAVLGDMELDDTLSKREEINTKIREELAEPTDQWGIRVESVEVKEITPSTDVLQSMEEQTSAERRRRAMILEAQGERRSSIEKAQGDKQSDIIRAQGEKQAQILEAQGDAISTVLRSRSADAMGEQAVIDKSLETLREIGEGPSETYVLPQEFSSTIGKYGQKIMQGKIPEGETLQGKSYDEEESELLGLDSIDEIIGEIEEVETMGQAAASGASEEVAGGQSQDMTGEADEIAGGQSRDVTGQTDDFAGGESRDAEPDLADREEVGFSRPERDASGAGDESGPTDTGTGDDESVPTGAGPSGDDESAPTDPGTSGDESTAPDEDWQFDEPDVPEGMPSDDGGDESEGDDTLDDMWDPGEDSTAGDPEKERETEEEGN